MVAEKGEGEGLLKLVHLDEDQLNDKDESETKNDWKKRLKAFLNHLGLLLTLMIYTALGGIIFCKIEYPDELFRLQRLDMVVKFERHQFLERLQSYQLNASEISESLQRYETAVQEAAQSGLLVPFVGGAPSESLTKWNNLQGIFFASTVLTTIGYGNMAPVTVAGRSFCILFALIGIPLTLTVIADLGRLMAGALPNLPEPRGVLGSLLSAMAALALLLLYLAAGAALFITWEDDWSFFQAFYFCFITMTTIGFGDLVPTAGAALFITWEDDWSFFQAFYFCFITMTTIGFGDLVPSTPKYMLLCTIYILIGLGLTSTIIELVRQQYARSWKRIQALAETLGRIASEQNAGDVHGELKRALAVLTIPKCKYNKTKDWEKAVKELVKEINNKPKSNPPVMQIIIYESSV